MVVPDQICEAKLSNAEIGLVSREGAGRRKAANSDTVHDKKLKDIHAAQLKAIMKRFEASPGVAPASVTAQDFYGNWADSFGNTVCVYSKDAYKSELVANLSRPPRADIMLHITPMQGGSGWFCGNAILSHVGASAEELSWTFPNGSVSVWRRQADGANVPSSPIYPVMPCSPEPSGNFDMSQAPFVTYVMMPYFVPSKSG